jgi:hypothetical protein
MKIKFTILCILLTISITGKAQNYVTIPDANFVTWLQAHIPSAMSGNQMDTSSTAVTTFARMIVENKGITNLDGVQYFDSLKTLDCGNDFSGITPNVLGSLPALPATLDTLICTRNVLTTLPVLPGTLIFLRCYQNQLTNLPVLPNSLIHLECYYNQIISLPVLPNMLVLLDCSSNQLTNLPPLTNALKELNCALNHLTTIPVLPNTLTVLQCPYNQLTSLPVIPSNLIYLDFSFNSIATVPALPNTLLTLMSCNNPLTSLPPTLPTSLHTLDCSNNQLTNLPPLSSSLVSFNCKNNNISCFPVFPTFTNMTSSSDFNISNNPITCLPNYISVMNAGILAYPLCVNGDTTYNPHGCASAKGIVGYAYADNNTNCTMDTLEHGLYNINLNLYNNANVLLSQAFSATNGVYNFSAPSGIYKVEIDTAGMPYTVRCIYPGIDSTVMPTGANPLVNNVNFDIACKPGFDVGVQAVVTDGWVFPGLQHAVYIAAGDLSNWYNLNCAAGVSGQVQITVTGPVQFDSIVPGALTPTVVGNIFTYTIADFDSINILQSFGLLFTTDTTAQGGDTICVKVTVTPNSGDNDTINNSYQHCYNVINSHDPNMKEVYPVNVHQGYKDYFTYTIHFQNTGTAPAMNIRVLDILSTNLDLKTFQLINYSHRNTISLVGNTLNIRFPNIQLPDSTSNLAGSSGYVQYRIKPKANLSAGTQIQNTANIYFDYNAPVVTNTTINKFIVTTSVNETKINTALNVSPNPSNGMYYVNVLDVKNNFELSIEVYNSIGEMVLNTKMQSSKKEIDLSHQPNGIYIVRIVGAEQSLNQRVIKQ